MDLTSHKLKLVNCPKTAYVPVQQNPLEQRWKQGNAAEAQSGRGVWGGWVVKPNIFDCQVNVVAF